jgi:Fe2+ or Zn2+ uptake regulation protein
VSDERCIESHQRVTAALDRIKAAGGHRTEARRLVLETLLGANDHLSVASIYRRMRHRHPHIDVSTVYRTAVGLCDLGILHVLAAPGKPRYGLADQPHYHALCSRCGAVTDVPVDAFAPVLDAAVAVTGFEIAPAGITVTGVCPYCIAAARRSVPGGAS